MENNFRKHLEELEYNAHINAFTKLGTFYWENFLVEEYYFNSKFNNKFNRRW